MSSAKSSASRAASGARVGHIPDPELYLSLTGTAVAHEHFAEHVEETLEYCKREPTEPYIIDGIDDYPMRAAVCIFHHADPSAPSRDRAPS